MTHNINRKKRKNDIIISIDTEKAFSKIQHPFAIFINAHSKLGMEKHLLNLIQKVANIILYWIIVRQGCLLLPLLFSTALEVIASAIRQEK